MILRKNNTFGLLKILMPVVLVMFHLPGYAVVTERVSLNSQGVEGNDESVGSSLSADGRFVAFASVATNLVAEDTNGKSDIFVHDRISGRTERVSVDSRSVEADGYSYLPSISADGRFVAFASDASNLVADDTNGLAQIFVHDRSTGRTEWVSLDNQGVGGNDESFFPFISADGRYVAFTSYASNLVAEDTNGEPDVFVHDRGTGRTERVNVDSQGVEGNDFSESRSISLSADGRFVAFESYASNLVVDDTNEDVDVFVHDRSTGRTERVGNSQGFQGGGSPSISADGRFVAFQSAASDLVADDTNNRSDIFVLDRSTGQTERVSVDSQGLEGNDWSNRPSISADGRFVAFTSDATNLVADDANDEADVFVHDRSTGRTDRVGSHGVARSYSVDGSASLSADGRVVAYSSFSTSLVAKDTNGKRDVFVGTLDTSAPARTRAYLDLAHIDDLNGNTTPEIAALSQLADGTARITIKDSQTKAFVNQVNFDPRDMSVAGLSALSDLNGNGAPELALLLVKSDGRGRVYIKDALTTQWVTGVNFFNPGWRAVAISSVDLDGDGVSEIAVLGVKDNDREAAIQVIDPVSKAQRRWLALPMQGVDSALRYFDLTGLGDANANDVPDLAALRTHPDGGAQVVVLDGTTRETINEIAFESYDNASITGLAALPDLDGNTAPELALLSVAGDGQALVMIKDALSEELVGELTAFDPDWTTLAISSSDDSEVAELAILGERDDLSATTAVILDAGEGTQLSRIPFAPGVE